MARTKNLQVCLNDHEWSKIEALAKARQITVTEVVRDWIKSLPDADPLQQETPSKAVQAYLSTLDQWKGVYQRLADS